MKQILRFACLFVLSLSFVTGAALAAGPKKKSVKKDGFPLITYQQFQKLNNADKEAFLDAVRDAMTGLQANDPTFAQYLMDTFLSFGVANAERAEDMELQKILDCESSAKKPGTVQMTIKKGDNCTSVIQSAIASGYYKNCSIKGDSSGNQYYAVVCNGGDKLFHLDGYQNDQGRFDPAANGGKGGIVHDKPTDVYTAKLKSAVDQNQKKTADPKVAADGSGKNTSADKPADTKNDAVEADTKPARCFYAGFAIKGGNKCSGVTDLCGSRTDTIPNLSAIQGEVCSKPENGRCNRSASSIAKNEQSKGDVICNPMLYGLAKDGGVICAPKAKTKGKITSQICNDKRGDLDTVMKILKGKDGEENFNSLLNAIKNTCGGKFAWGKSKTPDQGTYVDAESKKADWEALEKQIGVTNKGDLAVTCKALLNRVNDIARTQAGGAAVDFQKDQYDKAQGVQ